MVSLAEYFGGIEATCPDLLFWSSRPEPAMCVRRRLSVIEASVRSEGQILHFHVVAEVVFNMLGLYA